MSDADLAMRASLDYSAVSQGYDAIISGASKAQSGITEHFQKGTGDFKSIGENIGKDLTGSIAQQFGPLGNTFQGLATAIGPVGIAAGVAAAALAGVVVAGVQAAAQFETAMSGAKKVISLAPSADSDAYFAKLGEDLQQISLRAPVTATDMAALAAVGGSLGVASGEIAGFAESAAQMSVAFELPAEQAATAAAKILNAFQQPISTENMQSLGNVINQIGDSMAATESDILDFTNRASFLNTTMGLSVTQVASLGGVLISAGLTAETAAGGLKSAMNMLTSESSKTGGMDNWAKLMGVSVDELKTKVAADLPNTLIETANKIAAIEDPVLRFQTAVALAGSEGAPALLKLAGQQENYNSVLAKTIEQWDKGQAGEKGGMAKTFEQNSSTFNAQMQILSNSMTYASVAIGNVFLPVATQVATGLSSIVVAAVGAGKAIGSIVAGSNVFGALQSAVSSLGSVISAVFNNFATLAQSTWAAMGSGTSSMSSLQAVFNGLTAPATALYEIIGSIASVTATGISAMGPVFSAVGTVIGTVIVYASAFAQALTEIVGESETVKTISTIFDSIRDAISKVTEIAGKVFDGLTTAIPAAAAGVTTAIGSLFGQAGDAALAGFSDVVKDSPLGPVLGFVDSVSARANEIMASGKETGNALAEGIKQSDAQKAAVDLDNPENLEAAKKAGMKVGDEAGSAAAEGFELAFATAQADRDIARILAGSTANANDRNNVDWSNRILRHETTIGKTTIRGKVTPDQNGARYELFAVGDDGSSIVIATEYYQLDYNGMPSEYDIYKSLLSKGKITGGTDENIYGLMGRPDLVATIPVKIELENQWDVADSQKSWLKFSEENKDFAAQAGDEMMLALYNAEQQSIKDNDPTLQESLANVMKGLASPGSVPHEIFNESLGDIIDAGYVGEKWRAPLQEAADRAVSKLNWLKIDVGGFASPNIADLLLDPKKFEKNGLLITEYVKSEMLPDMKTAMEEAGEMLKLYPTKGDELYDSYVRPLNDIRDYLPIWLQGMMHEYETGAIDFQEFIRQFNISMDLTTEKIKDQTVGYDNLKAAIGDCAECAISEFGAWQEAQDNLFMDSYIGEGGAAYVGWKSQQMQRLAETQAGMYATKGTTVDLVLNTTQAEIIANSFKTEIFSMNPEMVMKLNDTAAKAELNALITEIEATHVMPVTVQVSANAGQIAAIVEAAISAAVADVRA